MREFVDYYNSVRAHSHRNFRPPSNQDQVDEWKTINLDQVERDKRLGGMIKKMRRAA